MRIVRSILLAAAAAVLFATATQRTEAQISFGVNIGPAPACPYGYYGYAPYNCAPYGYYGQQWFTNGAFLGAGPWFHGQRGFYGPVNHDFDPRYGYNGRFPERNPYREPADHWRNFHGNDWHGAYGEGHHEGFHGGHPPR